VTTYDRPPHYRSFLLTVWEEKSTEPEAPSVWRFRLEEARTGRRRGFASLEALTVFLRTELVSDRGELPD
jgi:hypothetical protein